MPVSRKDTRNGSFAMPLVGIAVLLTFYWLLADWHQLPALVSATLTTLHWPT
jgi:hypothetical protein